MNDVHRTGKPLTPQPPQEQLAGGWLQFDLQTQIEQLRSEDAYEHGRHSKILARYPDFRLVLFVIKAGVHIREHTSAGRISVQAVAGHIRMHVRETLIDLPVGRVLVIDRDIPHDVEAIDEGAFLLTIAWPEGALRT
jgi:quercetin dioxygenase-like cupin family protein